MPAFLRAAALSAAAFTFLAGAGSGGAGLASQSESAPTVPYGAHAVVPLTVANLGLNDLSDPAPDPGQLQSAPVASHAMAPAFPEPEDEVASADRRTLAELVADHQASETPDEETECLARAVYYESRTESLTGQLTVAEVVLNRANSGRFASTVCGVVRQRGQFSFVRGGVIPTPPPSSRDWRTSVAIARIAMQDLADGAAPRALFFHARRVNPGWRLTRVATVGNHVFYR
jgi:spore germination cell wall hydrolase CwlJ-like protein